MDEFVHLGRSISFAKPGRFWSAVAKRARVRVNEIVTSVGLTGGENSPLTIELQLYTVCYFCFYL